MISEREIFFKHMGLPSANPKGIEIKKAEGIYLFGADGKKYIDLVSGVSVSNLGHNNPHIIKAVKKQLRNFSHLMVYGEIIQSSQVKLAKLLADSLPEKLNCVYYVNSGSEAIEGALKLAKRLTGRSEIISFINAYHGSTHGSLSILGNEHLKQAFRPLLPDIRQLKFNNFEDLEKISEKTACVCVEPIQAEAGIILPDNEFLKALRNKCNETDTLLIFDEIQMGMGRTGSLFCFEQYDVVPDILCLAKAFGGGMPLGAFISSGSNMQELTRKPELGHITTFGGHPVSCAAGLASLNFLLKSGLVSDANKKGKTINVLIKDHDEVVEIRQKGLMLGVELKSTEKVDAIMNLFAEEGLLADRFLFNPVSFRIAPPLIISNEEIKYICKLVNKCLDRI